MSATKLPQYITIKAYDSYLQANLVLSKLLAENISCHLLNQNTMLADPILGIAIGGIQLQVHSSQSNRAIEIIQNFS